MTAPIDNTEVKYDEDVMRFMTEKFNVSREQILTTLKENAYDDISAIYMLLLDQKSNGKWAGSTTNTIASSPPVVNITQPATPQPLLTIIDCILTL